VVSKTARTRLRGSRAAPDGHNIDHIRVSIDPPPSAPRERLGSLDGAGQPIRVLELVTVMLRGFFRTNGRNALAGGVDQRGDRPAVRIALTRNRAVHGQRDLVIRMDWIVVDDDTIRAQRLYVCVHLLIRQCDSHTHLPGRYAPAPLAQHT